MADINITDFQQVDKVLKGINAELDKTVNNLVELSKKAGDMANKVSQTGTVNKKTYSETDKLAKQLKSSQEKLIALDGKQAKELARVRLEIQEKNKATKEEIKLQGAAEDSLAKMKARLKEMNYEYDRADAITRQKLAPSIKSLSDEIEEQEKATGRAGRGVGKYKDNIVAAVRELKQNEKELIDQKEALEKARKATSKGSTANKQYEEQLDKVQAELKQTQANLKSYGAEVEKQPNIISKIKGAAKGLMPAFGWAALIAGAVALTKKIFNLFQETAKTRRELSKLTGLVGQELADSTARVQAIADTFNKNFRELTVAANSYAQTMGISFSDALDLIERGFITGADANEEFLDKLREYGPQFKAAGISAEQAIALMSQEVKTGIYSDKGIDTIKEGTLRLREMPKATADALDKIGISSSKMQAELRNGTITVFQAIQQVSKRLAELPPQSSEVGTAIADIFGGPGEDAGLEFIKMLGTAQEGLDSIINSGGEQVKVQEKMLEANTELRLSWARLMGEGTSGFNSLWASIKLLTADGINGLIDGVQNVRKWFIDLYNDSIAFRGTVQGIIFSFKQAWEAVSLFGKTLYNIFETGGKLIGALFRGEFSKIPDILRDQLAKTVNVWTVFAENSVDNFKAAYNNAIEGELPLPKTEDPKQKGKIDAQTYIKSFTEETSKNKINSTINDTRLDDYKAVNDEIEAETNRFTQEMMNDERRRYELQKTLIENSLLSEQEKNKRLFDLDQQLLNSRINNLQTLLEAESLTADQRFEIEQELQDKLLELEQLKAERNAEQSEADKEAEEEKKEQRQRQIEDSFEVGSQLLDITSSFAEARKNRELNALEEKRKKGLISEEKYENERAKIEKQAAQRQKRIAIGQIIIDTARGVQKAIAASPLTLGLPWSALIAASGIAQIAKVSSTPAFKLGTKGKFNTPGTGFIAGDDGTELMETRQGKQIMVESPTYFEGEKWKNARIWSAPQTDRIIKANQIHSNYGIDNRKELKEIKKSIDSKPVLGSTLTAKGIRYAEKKANQTRIWYERL